MPNVRGDADSLRVLESYLDRRLGCGLAQARRAAAARSAHRHDPRGGARRSSAWPEGATAEEIRAAHRRLILRVHPDAGGSADLAARINRAKDVLLGV